MLGKLLKQDLKSSGKYFVPIYLVFIGIITVTKIIDAIMPNNNNTILNLLSNVSIITAVLAFLVINASTYLFIIMYFYRKCVSSEGYLTFTLPIKTSTHLISKTLIGVIWQILTLLVNILGIFILILGMDMKPVLSELSHIFNELIQQGYALVFVEFILLGLLSAFAAVLLFYVSLSIGQLFNRHKIAGAAGAFFVIYTAGEILGGISFLMLTLYEIPHTGEVMQTIQALQYIFLVLIALVAVFNIIFYVVTYFLLDRKLNLE